MRSYRYQGGWAMIRISCIGLVAMLWAGALLAEEGTEVSKPPEIVLDAPPAEKADPSLQTVKTKTITIYESKIFPGFRPCTSQDYHNHDYGPVACQDTDVARVLSTREEEGSAKGFVEGDAVPQGNIYKLRFKRFLKNKKQ